MAYTAIWSEAVPLGSLSASDIDQAIRDAKRDIRERLAPVFGMADWAADPLVPVSLVLSTSITIGGANPAAAGLFRVPNGQTIIAARNAANSADLIVAKMTGNVIEYGDGAMTVDTDDIFNGVKFTGLHTYHINNAGIYGRNQAGTVDMWMIGTDILDYVRVGTDGGSTGVIIGSNAKKLGFFAQPGIVQPTVAGAKGGNAALTSLMAALGAAGFGLVNDTTT